MASVDLVDGDLKKLFRDRHMFSSRETWRAAGFRVLDRSVSGKIMVAGHPLVPGLLFKKYSEATSQKDQLANYRRRVEGADRLRTFVDKQLLRHVVVPRKQLFELSHLRFHRNPTYILVVEQLDLLSDAQTRAAYYGIDPSVLRDLCTMLFHFRGMDSSPQNVPITVDGRIAFIDTEHWDRGNHKSYLHQVGAHLSADLRKLAKTIFDQLDGTRFGNVRRVFDEEDTSSSLSSS
jgi:hypothetical protein